MLSVTDPVRLETRTQKIIDIGFADGLFKRVIGYFSTVTVRHETETLETTLIKASTMLT